MIDWTNSFQLKNRDVIRFIKVLKTGVVIIGGVVLAIGVSILGAMALGGGDDNNNES